MSPRSTRQSGRSAMTDDYRHVALVRVHELLKLGYRRLDPSAYRTSHEDAISGDLADSIDYVLDSGAHEWTSYFSVHNEAPVRDRRRRGKQRRRLDIRIDSAERRPRTCFAFEAKPLDRAHGVKTYLGPEGLGRFRRGEYAGREDVAGMLGYVRSGSLGQWAEKIGRTLGRSPEEYGVVEGRNWRRISLVEGLEHTYCSAHTRPTVGAPIDIYHTLLECC